MRRMLGFALGGLMLLGACSDSDDDGDAKADSKSSDADADAYIDAAAAKLQEGGFALDEDAARCYATAGVNTIGVDNLRDADVTPDELAAADTFGSLDLDIPDGAVDDFAAALEDCHLAEAFITALFSAVSDSSGAELSPDATTCLTDHVDSPAVARAAAESSLADPTETEANSFATLFGDAFGACPDVMTELLVAALGATTPGGLTDTAKQCIATFVEQHTDEMAASFSDTEAEGADALGDLQAACPEAAAGAGGG